jgi:putative SOS response-associated peptidase YedK
MADRIPIFGKDFHPAHPPHVRWSWVWVYCVSPFCNHARAVAFSPWVIRWWPEEVGSAMRRHFKCSVCGRKGCVFVHPIIDGDGVEAFPFGREVRMGGQRLIPESYDERDARVLADFLARYPSGNPMGTVDAMCNLYSITSNQQAMRDLARAIRDMTGNFEPLPAVFPNRMAPVVRTVSDGVRELVMMRWGFPPPNIPGSKPRNPYLTNVRNTDSKYWQNYLKKPEHRCLVPVTSFAEPDNNQGPRSIWTWFAQDENRPLMFFAGIWREWQGDRGTKAAPDVGNHLVFSFLTADASPDVAPVHADATPVLLLDQEAREAWMNAPWEIARELQKPPPAGALKVVRTGAKEDVGL